MRATAVFEIAQFADPFTFRLTDFPVLIVFVFRFFVFASAALEAPNIIPTATRSTVTRSNFRKIVFITSSNVALLLF